MMHNEFLGVHLFKNKLINERRGGEGRGVERRGERTGTERREKYHFASHSRGLTPWHEVSTKIL